MPTAQALAEKVNRNRAQRGDAPVNARVEAGCVVIDPQFVAPPQAVAAARQLSTGDWRKARGARTRARLLEIVRLAAAPMTITEISGAAGLNEMTVRGHLYALQQDGRLERGQVVMRNGARRPAMTFQVKEKEQA